MSRDPASEGQATARSALLPGLRRSEARVRLSICSSQDCQSIRLTLVNRLLVFCREYLRKDICRGVTEYYPEEYPPLSHLIQELEAKERARLYPSRPAYEDEYSSFANYSASFVPHQQQPFTSTPGLPTSQPAQPALMAPSAQSGYQAAGQDHHQAEGKDIKVLELESIARRKAELEYKQYMAMQRIEQLQREKQEKARLGQAKPLSVAPTASTASVPPAPVSFSNDDSALKAAEEQARKNAEEKAEALRIQQEKVELALEQEKQMLLRKRRELEEQEKRRKQEAAAAEAARLEKEAELRRQALAAEEEKKRREEEKRAEEARRKLAEEQERKRQQQLAEERARLRHEAALEAKRQEQLARELAERKRKLRIQKQIQAMQKLRFHMWTKYVKASKALPAPVKIDASRFVAAATMTAQYKPKNTIQWLFKDEQAAAQVGTRLRNPSELIKIQSAEPVDDASILPDSNWSSLDVLSLVGPQLRAKSSSATSWKLVVGDLVDDQTSSFGVWCASKLGISVSGSGGSSSPPYRVFQSSSRVMGEVAVCCRYLDAASMDNATEQTLDRFSLGGVSALILSVSLSEIQDPGKRQRWLQRVESLFARLPTQSQVVASVVLFANVDPSATSRRTVGALEASIRQLYARFAQVVGVDFMLVSGSHESKQTLTEQLAQVLVSLSKRSVTPPKIVSVGVKELLEGGLSAAMKQIKSSSPVKIQEEARLVIRKIHEVLHSHQQQGAHSENPIPELQNVVSTPEFESTNSQWRLVENVLSTLASVQMDALPVQPTLPRDQVCTLLFAKIADFVDRLFASSRGDNISSEVSTFELKKLVYNLLVPVHEQLVNEAQGSFVQSSIPTESVSARLPWKQIFLEIYGAFFESLGDLSVSVPANWGSQHSQELLVVNDEDQLIGGETEPRAQFRRAPVPNEFGKVASPPPVVTLSLKSLKRSFGVALGSLSSSLKQQERSETRTKLLNRPTKEDDARLRRLRQEIARERAAASSFQQLLRREVNKWDAADFPSGGSL